MMYLIDTSVLVSHWHGNSKDATDYIRRVQSRQIVAAISVITYYEFWRGSKDAQRLETRTLLKSFKLLPLNKQIADKAAEIYKALPKSSNNDERKRLQMDILIAATAEHNHLDIVAINSKDFTLFNLKNCRVIPLVLNDLLSMSHEK